MAGRHKHSATPSSEAGPRTRGVVFDLDGVLVESEHLWEEAWTDYAAHRGIAWLAEDTRRCQGMSVFEWASYIGSRTASSDTEAARHVVGHVAAAYRAGRVALLEGAAHLVSTVADLVPIGLASSAPREIIDTVMSEMGLGSFFLATVSSAEVPRGKPSPDVYLEAIRQLGIDPNTSIAVEDSSNGVLAAAAAGLTVIAVPSPRYPLSVAASARAASIQVSLDGVEREIGRMFNGDWPGKGRS